MEEDKIDNLAASFHTFVGETRLFRQEQTKAVKCLRDNFLEFREKHEPTLTRLSEEEMKRRKLKDAIVEKVASSMIWGAIAGIAVFAWHGIKAAIGKVL